MTINYRITTECIQALLGTHVQFFLLDPTKFPHRPREARLVFLWEQLHHHDATIEIQNIWVPPLAHSNDQNIVDDFLVQQDARKGTLSAVRAKDIINANACRLYPKIYNLSDITTPDGKEIAPWAMDGSQQNHTHIIFPYQEKPHFSAWQTWRRQSRHTYLVKDLVLATPLTTPEVEELPVHQLQTFQQLILSLPKHEQQMMGGTELLKYDGTAIATSLRSGQDLSAWEDGSVKDAIGSHAWTVLFLTTEAYWNVMMDQKAEKHR